MPTKKFLYDIGTKGAKRAEKQLKGVDKATKSMVGSAAKLVVGFISIAAAVKGLQFAFAAAKLAAQAQNVERAFGNLAIQAGTTADIMIKKMREATAETISDFQLMQQFNTAAMLGLPLDQFDKMIEIARGAAQATGQSMQFMLQSIVTGIGRQSKLMLDNLGILISAESANKKYALAMGIVGRQLTDIERKQAFANEAVRIGLKNLDAMGGVVASSADKFEQLTARIENLRIEIGKLLEPTILSGLEFLFNTIKSAVEGFNQLKIDVLERSLESATTKYLKLRKELELFGDFYSASKVSSLKSRMLEISNQIRDWAEELGALHDITGLIKAANEDEGGGLIPEVPESTISAYQDFLNRIMPIREQVEEATDIIGDFSDALVQAAIYGQTMGEAISSAIRAIVAELLAAQIKRGIFALVNLAFGGLASFAGASMFSGISGSVAPSPNDQPQGTTINLNINNLIGTDEAAVRDQLVPILNRVMANA